MLEILRETTVWNTDFPAKNHTYLLDGDKLVAYAKFGSEEIVQMKSRIRIDKRYRTFVRDNHPGLQKIISGEKKDPDARTFKILSNDRTYFVTLKSNTFRCTCTGFNFRGKCKHVDAVVAKIQQPKP